MPTVPSGAPSVNVRQVRVQPVAAAVNATEEVVVAQFPAQVQAATYTPDGAVTGAATNNRVFNLVNRTQAGAVIATLTLAAGTNLVAGGTSSLTLSATPANLLLASGDVVEFDSTAAGTGLADPGGLLSVSIAKYDTTQ